MRLTSSSALEINILKLCLLVGGLAVQQNATLKPATFEGITATVYLTPFG